MNRRIFVEKKGVFDVESPKILNEIKSILPSIQSVKVFNIYDIFGFFIFQHMENEVINYFRGSSDIIIELLNDKIIFILQNFICSIELVQIRNIKKENLQD